MPNPITIVPWGAGAAAADVDGLGVGVRVGVEVALAGLDGLLVGAGITATGVGAAETASLPADCVDDAFFPPPPPAAEPTMITIRISAEMASQAFVPRRVHQ